MRISINALNGGYEEDTDNPSGGGPPYPDGSVDVSAFAGQTVRIKFVWNIPQPGTGFAFFQLDNIRLDAAPNLNSPVVTITAPADLSTSTDGDPINFAGTATDTEDGDISASLSWDSNLDGNIGSGAGFATAALSVGVHTITASVTDSGGLSGSDSIMVTVDPAPNTAPVVTITAPLTGSTFTDGDPINFAGTASDTEDGDISASLSWDSNLDGNIGSGAGFSTSTLNVGIHTITASVTDLGGLPGNDVITVTIEAPSAFDVTGINPTQMLIGEMIQLTVSGTGFMNPASITFLNGTGPAPVASAVNATNGNEITAMVTVDSKGPKKDRVWDMDVANGDGASETLVQAFTVTNGGGTGNNAPSATIISPADLATFASGAAVNFSGSASDAEDGDLTASLSWTSNIDGNLGTGGAISFALSDGVHTITASVTDSGGLAGSDTITITVGDPGVTVTSISPNQIQADPNQQVTISNVVIQGTGFVADAVVTFEGGGPASDLPTATAVLVVSDSQIVLDVTVPPISNGPKKRTRDVRVTNPDTSTGVLAGGFTVNR